jgi:hypothetical protein
MKTKLGMLLLLSTAMVASAAAQQGQPNSNQAPAKAISQRGFDARAVAAAVQTLMFAVRSTAKNGRFLPIGVRYSFSADQETIHTHFECTESQLCADITNQLQATGYCGCASNATGRECECNCPAG